MPTVITKSIGTTGRDYSTIASWEAAITVGLVAADEQWVGQCYNDSEFTITTEVVIAGQTVDATRNIILETGAGQSFRDHADKATNPQRYNSSVGVGVRNTLSTYCMVFSISTTYTVIRNLQIKADGTGNSNFMAIKDLGNTLLLDSIICEGKSISVMRLRHSTKLLNSLVLTRSSGAGDGVQTDYPNSSTTIAGCTIVRPNGLTIAGNGLTRNNGSAATVKNCAVFGFTDFSSGSLSGDYNASDDATNIPGANSNGTLTYSQQFKDYENASSDFRAATVADGGDLKFGTPDATNTPDDIIGTTRDVTTPWVGCWEIGGANPKGIFGLALDGPFRRVVYS
jgi:hypothetical protein